MAIHRICHSKIHAVLSERALRDYYHCFDRLRSHPEISKFVQWIARKDPEFVGRTEPPRKKGRS